MKLCVFEDDAVDFLEPLALTRPAFDLRCGVDSLLERQRRFFATAEAGAWIRRRLAPVARHTHPGLAINDLNWLRKGPCFLANARWLAPTEPLLDSDSPRIGVVDDQVAYIVAPQMDGDEMDRIDAVLTSSLTKWPHVPAGGRMLQFPWDFVAASSEALTGDALAFRASRRLRTMLPANVTIMGDPDDLLIADDATIESNVSLDLRQGPILIDHGAVVQSFSRIEGPCFIGSGSVILGGRISGGANIGPGCRVGGEIHASVVQARTTKYHDGVLAHSFVGECVELAAAAIGDPRGRFGVVDATVNGQRVRTGSTRVGAFIGDHTRIALGSVLGAGSVVGAFCNILPSGGVAPAVIPSFCEVRFGSVLEEWNIKELIADAQSVLGRHGLELTRLHRELYFDLFDATNDLRQQIVAQDRRRPNLAPIPGRSISSVAGDRRSVGFAMSGAAVTTSWPTAR